MEGLKTFKHSFRNKGRIFGKFSIQNGLIHPRDEKEQNFLLATEAFKRGSVFIVGEDELASRTTKHKVAGNGVVIQAPAIFSLFTNAENQEIKKLTPSSKKKIYNFAAELIKLELGTEWGKLEEEKKKERKTEKKVKLIEIPKKPTVKQLREICSSQNPPIEFETQADKDTLLKLIEERNNTLALEQSGKAENKEKAGKEEEEIKYKKPGKSYTAAELEKLSGAELDKLFHTNGLDSSDLKDDAEKREVLASFFENVKNED